jgi:hypothetical protein
MRTLQFMAGGALLLALMAVPFALPERRSAGAAPAETVSLAGPAVSPPAGPMPGTPDQAIAAMDLRPAWRAFLGLQVFGVPTAPASRRRFVAAFFDGRLPSAAGFVRRELRNLKLSEAASIADRARCFDRALVLLAPAPEPLVRIFVERSEDPEAHLEAARAHRASLAALVGDAALGARAFALLRAAGPVPPEAMTALATRLATDVWARTAMSSAGSEAVPCLVETLGSDDPARRAAAAWLLAGLAGEVHANRIIQVAVPELGRDAVPGNAGFAIRALSALGSRARPVAAVLLRSSDDQVVAGALEILIKTGGASPEDLETARPRVERLAARAAAAGDEAVIGIEVRAALTAARGAMDVPDPPAALKSSHVGGSARTW